MSFRKDLMTPIEAWNRVPDKDVYDDANKKSLIYLTDVHKHFILKQKVKEEIMKQINKRPSGNSAIDVYINGIQLMEDLEIRK